MPDFKFVEYAPNAHGLTLAKGNRLAVLSCLHWDNPNCDQELLKKHLEYCLINEIPVMVHGDFFCLMQGKGDRRGSKSDIRPEHNNTKYLDSIVDTAIEWFSPYAHIFTVLGYGNHETSIIKYQETDILKRFVDGLNLKNNSNVKTGGYGGWLQVTLCKTNSGLVSRIKYFHGSGGGGIVTKGAINLTRALEMYEGMDVFTMGHVHENMARNDVRDTFVFNRGKRKHEIQEKQIHLMITGTYKNEYHSGAKGWAVERGIPSKPLGGRILVFDVLRKNSTSTSTSYSKQIDSTRFPLL